MTLCYYATQVTIFQPAGVSQVPVQGGFVRIDNDV